MQKPFQTQESREEQEQLKANTYTIKMNVFTQAIKRIENLLLISFDESSARYEYTILTQTKKQKQFYLQLTIKKNLLALKSYLELDKLQFKNIQKHIHKNIEKINHKLISQLFLSKVFIQTKTRLMIFESSLNLGHCQNLSLIQISTPFVNVVKESFQTLKQIEELILGKKYQLLTDKLNKSKDDFEQNRIRRQKSTKISLLSKDMKDLPDAVNIFVKIIMHYRYDLKNSTTLSRILHNKYKTTKQKLTSEPITYMMQKLKQKVNKQKQGDSSRTQQTSSFSEHNRLIQHMKIQRCYIFKPICIFQEHYIETLEPGGFGEVFKYRCVFQQLDTVASQSQKQINQQIRKRQIIIERAQLKDVLIRKNPKQCESGKRSFNIEYQCLSFLRSLQCPQIAQFYKVMDKKQSEQNKGKQNFKNSIYSKYYPHEFAQCANSFLYDKLKVMLDLIEGIECLSDNKILHRDIKPGNIRLTKKFKVKIIDFGSACLAYGSEKINELLANDRDQFCYTRQYTLKYAHAFLSVSMSKEEYTRHVYYDLYAYGIIVQKMFNQILETDQFFGSSLRYLSQKCMEHNPQDRLSPHEIRFFLTQLIKSYQIYSQI